MHSYSISIIGGIMQSTVKGENLKQVCAAVTELTRSCSYSMCPIKLGLV